MAVAGQVERPELLATQEVSFRSEGAKIPAYLARPRESGRYPGVILIHDIFGVSDHARDVARRLANIGFVTLVPDCFARIDLGTGETIEDVRPRIRGNLRLQLYRSGILSHQGREVRSTRRVGAFC